MFGRLSNKPTDSPQSEYTTERQAYQATKSAVRTVTDKMMPGCDITISSRTSKGFNFTIEREGRSTEIIRVYYSHGVVDLREDILLALTAAFVTM